MTPEPDCSPERASIDRLYAAMDAEYEEWVARQRSRRSPLFLEDDVVSFSPSGSFLDPHPVLEQEFFDDE